MRLKVRCDTVTTWWSGESSVAFTSVAQHASDVASYATDPPTCRMKLTYRSKANHGMTAGSLYYVTIAAASGGALDLTKIDEGTSDTGWLSVVEARSAAPGPKAGTIRLVAVDAAFGSSLTAWSLSIAAV